MKPIDTAIAWPFTEESDWIKSAKGDSNHLLYARNTPAPVVTELEQCIARMEGAEYGLAFSSGMAAIYATLMTLLKPGAKIVALDALYGGTFSLLHHVFPSWGVDCRLVRTTSELFTEIEQGCDIVYLETPSNPMLLEVDISATSALAKKANALLVCDNTVATPFAQNPIEHGADIVIHSATKFLGGHMDALAGVVCCSAKHRDLIHQHRELIGSVLAPQAAQLIARGLETFELRMSRATDNATQLAARLNNHPKVTRVFHPSINLVSGESTLQRSVALLSFELENRAAVSLFLKRCDSLTLASTLGATHTLIGLPETTSHVECSVEERTALGIPEGLVRVSVGIEPIDQLLAWFDHALSF